MSFSAVSPTNSLQPYRAPVFDAATFQAMIDAAPENPARAVPLSGECLNDAAGAVLGSLSIKAPAQPRTETAKRPRGPDKRKRRAVFTDGRQAPLDDNDRTKLMALAQAARLAGKITRAGNDIMEALVYKFANREDGRCFPAYKALAEAAGCCERTVGRCLPDLEDAGLLEVFHRLTRLPRTTKSPAAELHKAPRIGRTSNGYSFPLVNSKGHFDLRNETHSYFFKRNCPGTPRFERENRSVRQRTPMPIRLCSRPDSISFSRRHRPIVPWVSKIGGTWAVTL